MPRTTLPLTDTQIKQAKKQAKEYNLSDGNGLQLRIKTSGSKLWLFNYTNRTTKKRSNLSLGPYPALPLASARKLAQEYQSHLAEGRDPKTVRDEKLIHLRDKYKNSLEHVARNWLDHKKCTIKPNYHKKIKRCLELYIFPKLGKTPITELNAKQTIEAIDATYKQDKLETVKKLCRWLNEIMTFALNSGIVFNNPLAGIGKAFRPPKTTNLPTLPPSELPNLMHSIRHSSTKQVTRILIEWQLHTITRPAEAAGTRWEEIDIESAIWTIPAARMKGGTSHKIPLSPESLKLLESIKPISGHREFVFPSDSNAKKPTNSQTANMALRRMGYAGKLVSHGLRALASTTLNEAGFESHIIEAALSHKIPSQIITTYNRSTYLDARTPMMNWWSRKIEHFGTPNPTHTVTK